MAKITGIGQAFIAGAYIISNDVSTVTFTGSRETMLSTGIDVAAIERLPLLADHQIEIEGFFNKTGAHPRLDAGRVTQNDVIVSYLIEGPTVGGESMTIASKQVNYDGTRANNGELGVKATFLCNGQEYVWGKMLTAGSTTYTSGTDTASQDLVASSTAGTFVVHCTAFTGSTVTVKLQHSTNNSTWSDVGVSTVFTAVGAVALPLTAATTVNRYVRANIAGTFTTIDVAAAFCKGV